MLTSSFVVLAAMIESLTAPRLSDFPLQHVLESYESNLCLTRHGASELRPAQIGGRKKELFERQIVQAESRRRVA